MYLRKSLICYFKAMSSKKTQFCNCLYVLNIIFMSYNYKAKFDIELTVTILVFVLSEVSDILVFRRVFKRLFVYSNGERNISCP